MHQRCVAPTELTYEHNHWIVANDVSLLRSYLRNAKSMRFANDVSPRWGFVDYLS